MHRLWETVISLETEKEQLQTSCLEGHSSQLGEFKQKDWNMTNSRAKIQVFVGIRVIVLNINLSCYSTEGMILLNRIEKKKMKEYGKNCVQ
jgi:hypothetical protein